MAYIRKTRKCKICGKLKRLDIEYYKSGGSYCIECCQIKAKTPENKEKNKAWRERNKERASKYYKDWYFVNGRKRKPKDVIIGEIKEIKEINGIW